MTSQTAPRETEDRTGAFSPDNLVPRYRAFVGAVILALAVAAALAAGGWGLVSSLTGEAPPARIGENAEVPGGLLRVEKVTPEHMAAMQSSKFAGAGMSMSSGGMDMAPEGQRRFSVDVTLAARGGLEYAPEDFSISGKGFKAHGPVRSQLGEGSIADGSAVAGTLVFQVPKKSRDLMLAFDGGRPVALDLPASKDDGQHGH